MRFAGTIERARRYRAVEVPDLGVYTQGTSNADAYRMASEALETVIDAPGFRAEVFPGGGGYFGGACTTPAPCLATECARRSGRARAEPHPSSVSTRIVARRAITRLVSMPLGHAAADAPIATQPGRGARRGDRVPGLVETDRRRKVGADRVGAVVVPAPLHAGELVPAANR